MKKPLLTTVLLSLCVSSLFAVTTPATQELPVSELVKQNKQIVKLASEEISKTLPQKVDKYTDLLRVEGHDTTLLYLFEINTGAKSDESIIKEDHARMKKAITKGICRSSKRFLDAEINISYRYISASTQKTLFQFDIRKSDCTEGNR